MTEEVWKPPLSMLFSMGNKESILSSLPEAKDASELETGIAAYVKKVGCIEPERVVPEKEREFFLAVSSSTGVPLEGFLTKKVLKSAMMANSPHVLEVLLSLRSWSQEELDSAALVCASVGTESMYAMMLDAGVSPVLRIGKSSALTKSLESGNEDIVRLALPGWDGLGVREVLVALVKGYSLWKLEDRDEGLVSEIVERAKEPLGPSLYDIVASDSDRVLRLLHARGLRFPPFEEASDMKRSEVLNSVRKMCATGDRDRAVLLSGMGFPFSDRKWMMPVVWSRTLPPKSFGEMLSAMDLTDEALAYGMASLSAPSLLSEAESVRLRKRHAGGQGDPKRSKGI